MQVCVCVLCEHAYVSVNMCKSVRVSEGVNVYVYCVCVCDCVSVYESVSLCVTKIVCM